MALLEDLFEGNPVVLLGVGMLAATLPRLAPGLRPGMVSAIRIGLELFSESEAEAESDLVQSLVDTTISMLRRDLAKPLPEAEKRATVRHHIHQFKQRAATRSRRWTGDEAHRDRLYHRHVKSLEVGLKRHRAHAAPVEHSALDEAFTQLAT